MNLPKSLELIPTYNAPSSWWEHVPIAHWLVEKVKPATIVELGTHYGVSFFSFCEAAANYSPNTHVYAVDTWQGDKQAGYYENDVFNKVYSNRERYHSQRSTMLRCTFEKAAENFSERTIDIIHIDGLHTYEAVRNDFEIWQSKLKKDGTIIFHDWNVRDKDFGVWKLWDEIKKDSKYHCIETPNGYGLGLATLSTMEPIWHGELKKDLPILVTKGKLLKRIQDSKETNTILRKEKELLEQHTENLEKIRDENMKYIVSLVKELENRNKKNGGLQLYIKQKIGSYKKRVILKMKKSLLKGFLNNGDKFEQEE